MALFTCTILFTCTVLLRYCSRYCSHRQIDDVALTNEVSRSCWTKILMHYLIDDVATYQWTKNLAYGTCITQDYFQPNSVTVQPGSNRVIVHPRGQTAYCWLMTWRNPERPKCFLSDGHDLLNVSIKRGPLPPNLISLNLFLDSIFCNSFSILYFLCILINFHFAPSSIMSS